MALSPKERADFDEIVLRLRLEDADLGVIQPRRRPFTVLLGVLAAAVVLTLGILLLSVAGVIATVITLGVLTLLAVAGRAVYRSRSGGTSR